MFVATLIRSAFGFGEALIAVPLLAFFMPVKVAAPLAVLVSITIAAVVVVQDWRHIHVRSAGWLVFSTLFGIPLGLLLLTRTPEHLIKLVLGGLILIFALFCLAGSMRFRLQHDSRGWLLMCGFRCRHSRRGVRNERAAASDLRSLRNWTAQHFRATLQAYFLPASLLGMLGYLSAGLWTQAVTYDYLLCLPVLLPAVFLGRVINHRLSAAAFSKYVYAGLAAIGAGLVAQSIVQVR